MGTPWIHGRDPLASLVTLRKIDHPSYKCLEWKFRAEVLELTTNYWPIVQGCSGDGALGYWKVIANLFELDEMTWRHLILKNIWKAEHIMEPPEDCVENWKHRESRGSHHEPQPRLPERLVHSTASRGSIEGIGVDTDKFVTGLSERLHVLEQAEGVEGLYDLYF